MKIPMLSALFPELCICSSYMRISRWFWKRGWMWEDTVGLLLTCSSCSQVWILAGACQPLLCQLRLRPCPGHQHQWQWAAEPFQWCRQSVPHWQQRVSLPFLGECSPCGAWWPVPVLARASSVWNVICAPPSNLVLVHLTCRPTAQCCRKC